MLSCLGRFPAVDKVTEKSHNNIDFVSEWGGSVFSPSLEPCMVKLLEGY